MNQQLIVTALRRTRTRRGACIDRPAQPIRLPSAVQSADSDDAPAVSEATALVRSTSAPRFWRNQRGDRGLSSRLRESIAIQPGVHPDVRCFTAAGRSIPPSARRLNRSFPNAAADVWAGPSQWPRARRPRTEFVKQVALDRQTVGAVAERKQVAVTRAVYPEGTEVPAGNYVNVV